MLHLYQPLTNDDFLSGDYCGINERSIWFSFQEYNGFPHDGEVLAEVKDALNSLLGYLFLRNMMPSDIINQVIYKIGGKMIKKFLAIFMVATMLSSLAGCGDSEATRSGIIGGSSSRDKERTEDGVGETEKNYQTNENNTTGAASQDTPNTNSPGNPGNIENINTGGDNTNADDSNTNTDSGNANNDDSNINTDSNNINDNSNNTNVYSGDSGASEPMENLGSNEDFQMAMDAYSQQFTDSWGALIEMPGSSIPLYFDLDSGIYHYQGGQIVILCELEDTGNTRPSLKVNVNDRIIHLSDSSAMWGWDDYYEYGDGSAHLVCSLSAFQDDYDYPWIYHVKYANGESQEIDEATASEITSGFNWSQEVEVTIQFDIADAITDYMLNR